MSTEGVACQALSGRFTASAKCYDSEDLKSISDVEGQTGPTEPNGCQPKESHVRLCLGASQPQQSATDSEDLKSISES